MNAFFRCKQFQAFSSIPHVSFKIISFNKTCVVFKCNTCDTFQMVSIKAAYNSQHPTNMLGQGLSVGWQVIFHSLGVSKFPTYNCKSPACTKSKYHHAVTLTTPFLGDMPPTLTGGETRLAGTCDHHYLVICMRVELGVT